MTSGNTGPADWELEAELPLAEIGTPDGRVGMDVVRTLEMRSELRLPRLPASLIHPEDRVILTHYDLDDPEGSEYTTTVTVLSKRIGSLLIGSDDIQNPRLEVEVEGKDVPEGFRNTSSHFIGSFLSRMGSVMMPGAINIGEYPGFFCNGYEWGAPKVSGIKVERPNKEGKYEEVRFNTLRDSIHSAEHGARIEEFRRLESIVNRFGFRFQEVDDRGLLTHEVMHIRGCIVFANSENIVTNSIYVFDPKDEELFGLVHDTRTDTLQIAYVPISYQQLSSTSFGGRVKFIDTSMLYRSRQPIVTYNSSGSLSSVDGSFAFHPGADITKHLLPFLVKPGADDNDVHAPTINVLSDGSVSVHAWPDYLFAAEDPEKAVSEVTSAEITDSEVVLNLDGGICRLARDPLPRLRALVDRLAQ